jgi:sugar lactone lactonase YvrE
MLLIEGFFFAGLGSPYLGDIWTWSGSNWTQQKPAANLAQPRAEVAAGYDAATGQFLLFGGVGPPGELGDTWLWTRFAIDQPTLPVGSVGSSYSTTVDALAGTAPYTWSVSAGSLPAGLSLNPTAGIISGTPETSGRSRFTLSVSDSAGHVATRSYTLSVNPVPSAALWVSNGANSTLHAFSLGANGNASPSVTLGGPATHLFGPAGLVLDPAGDVYVSNSATPSITVYAAGASGNAAPIRMIQGSNTGLTAPAGITLDSRGRLYVANGPAGTVTVYPAGANGDQRPVQLVGGSNTGLRDPGAVAVDGAGHLWVSDIANQSLVEFAAGANGDVAPLQTISGPATGLTTPEGLAQDSSGRLLVSNLYGQSITEYANAPPFGNARPQFTLSGPGSQLNFPIGLDVDAADDLYVANQSGGVTVYPPLSSIPSAVIAGSATGLAAPHALAVAPPMTIATRSLPTAGLGRRYSAKLIALLGASPLRWRIIHGHLPVGLHLSRSGRISGVPRTLGRFALTVEVRGSSRKVPRAKRRVTLLVRAAPTVTGLTPAAGRSGHLTKVTIHGTGFATGRGATIIDFGRFSAIGVRCRSHTECTARAPAHARGAVEVTVTVDGLASGRRPGARFTYRR